MGINRVVISGNLTRDPDLRQTASGMEVLGFGVAVNDRRKNAQTGEWEDYPNFVDCTLFGNRARGIAPYLAKGSKVAIEGKLRWSSWEKDGQKRSKLEVIVDEIELMQQRQAAQQPRPGQAQPIPQQQAPQAGYFVPQQVGYASQAAPQQQYAPAPVYDEDIPF
ncbi:single-stranded DNA-binding protein [Denitrobacterium detoxificans]|uniref:Single-stranded DNA-binding protein n=1 Tax=Denitrobacterium detoxificans TaxID=79604 RepID=A0A172RXI4_9ACTN|nr:single-stranded DNA-binding protein [Denitrobacterium detoxificans]ANE22430.1 single-stranded DNA-binding protein [Denitrobacterium detoxificans]SEO81562.1 single-strand DNA-binding protein [Denitrobacterium detoxificans]SEP01573.1 single-strand DNA-binding protein [Denitrobacterium detoxificans]